MPQRTGQGALLIEGDRKRRREDLPANSTQILRFALHRFVRGQVDGRLDGQIVSARDALRVTPDDAMSLDPVANGPPSIARTQVGTGR
jgi:hypothetical protein